jgi:lipopolysaccharide export system permease protein
MKILDRYVLGLFLKNYLISFMVLIGLFIVLDMVFNFDEFAEVRTQGGGVQAAIAIASGIANYYFYRMFLIFVQLAGIIPVVAAAFTLMRLSRFNELAAILAAGVPLVRVAMPIIFAGLFLNVLVFIDQELIIPKIIPQLTRARDEAHATSAKSFPVHGMEGNENVMLVAGMFTPGTSGDPATMRVVDFIERDEQARAVRHISADSAQWDPDRGQWTLTNGLEVRDLLPHQVHTPPKPIEVYPAHVTPTEIALYRSGDYVALLSTRDINQLLQQPRIYRTGDLLRVKHFRWTQLVANVLLLLLAIPCVLTREPGMLKAAAAKTLLITGICMGAIFLCYHIAGSPPPGEQWTDRWQAMWAWAPIFVFGPLAVFLLDRTSQRS